MQKAIKDKENDKLKILRTNLQELSDIEDKSIEAVDPSYAEAKRFTKKLEKNLEDAFEEKDKFTDEFIKENDKRENKPMYTPEMKKLKLSESLFEDYITEKKDDMDEVEELDDDMFTYIYDLFTRGNRYNRPNSPIGKKIKGFDYTSKRDSLDSGFEITTNINGNIELRSTNPDDFNQAKEVCDKLNIQCRIVEPKKWDKEKLYTFEIIVPTDENGDPISRKEFLSKVEEDWRTGTFTREDLTSYRTEMIKRIEAVSYSIRGMKEKHPEYAEIFDNLIDELVEKLKVIKDENDNIRESLQGEDGWSDEIIDKCRPFFSEVEQLSYCVKNLVRGAYGTGETVEDLISTFRELSQNAEELADELERADEDGDLTESLNEDFKLITGLSSYEPWGGAIETMGMINDAGMFDDLERYLEEVFPDGATITEVNDLLWYDGDEVLADLGME